VRCKADGALEVGSKVRHPFVLVQKQFGICVAVLPLISVPKYEVINEQVLSPQAVLHHLFDFLEHPIRVVLKVVDLGDFSFKASPGEPVRG
jgi:hypothetical protein